MGLTIFSLQCGGHSFYLWCIATLSVLCCVVLCNYLILLAGGTISFVAQRSAFSLLFLHPLDFLSWCSFFCCVVLLFLWCIAVLYFLSCGTLSLFLALLVALSAGFLWHSTLCSLLMLQCVLSFFLKCPSSFFLEHSLFSAVLFLLQCSTKQNFHFVVVHISNISKGFSVIFSLCYLIVYQ